MKVTIGPRGSALSTAWLGLCAAAAGIICWLFVSAAFGFFLFAGLFALAAAACRIHRIGYSVELKSRECVIDRGVLLRSVIKLPRRYITAATCFSTPLSRALGVGVLGICSSGRLTVIVGLSLPDIAALREQLWESGAE